MKLHDSQQTFNKPSDDPAPIVQTSLLVPYSATLVTCCVEIPCDREVVVRWSVCRNGLNLHGSYLRTR